MAKNKGIFNLDYEETKIVLSREGRLKKTLKDIFKVAVVVLGRAKSRGIDSETIGMLEKIRDLSDIKDE